MKILAFGMLFFVLICTVGAPAFGQFDAFGHNDVIDHESLVVECAQHFSNDALVRLVTILKLEHQGNANLDVEGIHNFVNTTLAESCAQLDCADPVSQAYICGLLPQKAIIP